MTVHNNIENILNKIANISGGSPPAFDDDGRCVLEIQDISILLEASSQSNSCLLMSIVYRGPPHLEIFKEALSGNLYWNKTKGCTLMWENSSNSLILCLEKQSETLDFQTFTQSLSDFHTAAHLWLETCQRIQEETQNSAIKHF
ncbi:MAG: type III secretion system chaperone [Parachlamydiales bacterium]|jgi:hypothetical protein